jgi:transposase-like protein
MPRHPRRTADQWRALIEQHSQGSLSLAEFCRKKKLSPSNFHRWRRKLQQDEGAGFLEIQPPLARPDRQEGGWMLELDLPGGGHLRLRFAP